MPEIWDMYGAGDSSPEAEMAFVTYRDLGPTRSLAKAAAKVGKNISLLERWSSRDDWGRRVRAYDSHLESEQRKAMAARHANLAADMLEKVAQKVASLDFETLSPGVAAKWVETAAKLERLSLDAPSSITEQRASDVASADEVRQFLAGTADEF